MVAYTAAYVAMQHKKTIATTVSIFVAILFLLVGGILLGFGLSGTNSNLTIAGGVLLGIGALVMAVTSFMVHRNRKAKREAEKAQSAGSVGDRRPLLQNSANFAVQRGTAYDSTAASESDFASPTATSSQYQPIPDHYFLDNSTMNSGQSVSEQRQNSSAQSESAWSQSPSSAQGALAAHFGALEQGNITPRDLQNMVKRAVQAPETRQMIRNSLPPKAQAKFDSAMLFAQQNPQFMQQTKKALRSMQQSVSA